MTFPLPHGGGYLFWNSHSLTAGGRLPGFGPYQKFDLLLFFNEPSVACSICGSFEILLISGWICAAWVRYSFFFLCILSPRPFFLFLAIVSVKL